MNPLVSILIPFYGVERYIEQCAESVFSQTYDNLEFVFVDDCSLDKSREILEACIARHPEWTGRTHLVTQKKNKGIAAARHALLSHAKGAYVCFVDSDDYLPPIAIDVMVKKALETQADIVESAYRRVGHKHEKVIKAQHCSKTKRVRRAICHKGNGFIWGKLIRKSLFDNNDIQFVEGINFAEDFSVFPLLLMVGTRAWVDEVAYCYRLDNQSSYTHHIDLKSILSEARAATIVRDFFIRNDHERLYRRALLLGLLIVYRNAHRNHIATEQFAEIDRLLNYHSEFGLDEWFYRMFHSKQQAKWIYKAFGLYRKAYLCCPFI